MLSALAVLVFCLLYTVAIAAQTQSQTLTRSLEKTKAEVQRLGFGRRVKVKLQNGTKVRGRITALADDQFVVTDSDTGATARVAYADVAGIHKQREMPRALKGVFIGIAVTAAVVGTLIVLALAVAD